MPFIYVFEVNKITAEAANPETKEIYVNAEDLLDENLQYSTLVFISLDTIDLLRELLIKGNVKEFTESISTWN